MMQFDRAVAKYVYFRNTDVSMHRMFAIKDLFKSTPVFSAEGVRPFSKSHDFVRNMRANNIFNLPHTIKLLESCI